MVAELLALLTAATALLGEWLHRRRTRRVSHLAFGPAQRAAFWTWTAAPLRVVSLTALTWGFATLLLLPGKVHNARPSDREFKHLILLLDVSPSMQLPDAGPQNDQRRMARCADLMDSLLKRASVEQFRISVIAVYNGAKAVVVDTRDRDVLSNILHDLPMHLAFDPGETDLFSGLREAAALAKPWNPGSTTLLILSDGDTIPAQGMPKLPVSVARTLVVGVGDSRAGKFIDGHQSRQEASILAQLATRLGGVYHNANHKHIPTDLAREFLSEPGQSIFHRLTRREYALLACGLGTAFYAMLPWALHRWGTAWRPGVVGRRERSFGAERERQSVLTH